MNNYTRKELVKRYILFIIGLFFLALGVACTKHGELGVSPISSVSNVLSCRFDALSLGTWLIIWNCTMILGQIIILRRKFQLIQLLQLPLSFLFGWFTDLGMLIVSPIPLPGYFAKLALVLLGIVILSFGISLTFIANVIMNSGEAFVKAIADTLNKDFGNVKVGFDIFCVALALVLSLILFDFNIIGIREGTILSALFAGVIIKFFNRKLKNGLESLLK